ncbi:hypothetical protein NDU88_003488 [Pleurodeles waltl]|uniref:Uncharacterized protein n=1 Tax=Pleurodeles waltl TaxID=8319 RepID=A0AAV7TPX7_PLEWA|nr:hypothetical protein NDU88_003488 [Pleurodeles waltl]
MPAEGPGPPPSGLRHSRSPRPRLPAPMVAGSPVQQACGAPPQTWSQSPGGANGYDVVGTIFCARSGPHRSRAAGWATPHLREKV